MDETALQSYIDKFLIKEIRASKKELYNDGICVPKVFFILYDPDNTEEHFNNFRIPRAETYFVSDHGKGQLKKFIQEAWYSAMVANKISKKKVQLGAVIVISDAFISEHKVEDLSKFDFRSVPRASEDPNRKECLIASVETSSDKSKLMKHPYTRIGKEIQFDNSASEFQQLEEGRFYHLFPNIK